MGSKRRRCAAQELSETGLDERIAVEVHELLVTDPDIDVEDLRVKVQGGIVTLEGRTGTAPNKHLAAAPAQCVGYAVW